MAKTRILVLFAQEWDRLALRDPRLTDRYELLHSGFDLFRFPENARLLTFDARRYVDRMVRVARREGVAGVISPHEQFGTLIAAELAQRLGLPGPDPRSILRAQHKYYARVAMAAVIPDATPRFRVFPYDISDPGALTLPLPCFVKPVKAAFSVLARRIDSFEDLRRHLRFGWFERLVAERLIRPFDDILATYPELAIDAHHLVAEELIEGIQVNVDGYADRGQIRILGIVDELMYPGTIAFNRFEYPSSLPETVQSRVAVLARQAVQAVGFDHGLFNVEICYDPRTDAAKVVEINPRVASQFVTLYRSVDGVSLYDLMLSLAVGEEPRYEPRPQAHAYAASFVFRRFHGWPVHPAPRADQLAQVAARHPDARLMLYFKRGAGLAREMKWLGSHRFAVVNLSGADRAELYARYRDIRDTLGFARHAGPEPAPLWSGTQVAPPPEAVLGTGGGT